MVTTWTATWDRWLHPQTRESSEARRSALVTSIAAVFAFVFVLAQAVASVLGGHPERAVPSLVFLAAPLTAAWLLHARPSPAPAGHVLIGFSSTLVGFAVAGEDSFSGSTIAWFGVIGATAVVGLGPRAGLWWMAVDTLAVVVIEALRLEGLITPWLFPAPWLGGLRGLGLVSAFLVLAVLFERTRREAIAEARKLAQAKSHFLANVSHELRTPMNGVLGMTDLLLRSELSAEQREQLELLQRSGKHLVLLLNDLLDMSKVEAGKMELDPIDFDLRQHLDDLRALQEPVARARGLSLVVIHEGLPAAVHGDAMRLRQVLNNLVNNALKFTPQGTVTVRARPGAPGRYHFEVEDSGIGIPRAVLPRLFSPFTQADVGVTRKFGGTGLGLVLCRELVLLMGGTIDLESEPGRGTVVRFEVPLGASVSALAEAPAQPASDAPKLSAPVLVVDDNPINLKVACGLVQKAGYRTLSATNGREALQVISAHAVSLVLMDCHMPEMDGFEATERIRAMEGDAAFVPIIALTASAMPEELERCKRAGMNDCLIKPVSLEMLERTLRQVATLEQLSSTNLT